MRNTGIAAFPEEELPGSLRFVNLMADVAGFDASALGASTNTQSGIASGSAGPVAQLEAGAYRLVASMETDPATEFLALDEQVIGGVSHTLAVGGSFSNDTVLGRYVREPQRRVNGLAQVNLVHGAPAAESIDVYLLQGDESVANNAPDVPGLNLLSSATVTTAAGAATLVLTAPGDSTAIAEERSITLNGGGLYSVYVGDAAGGGTPLRLVLGGDFE